MMILYYKQMVKKKSNAPRQHIRLMEKSFQPALLDQPLKRKRRIKNKRIYFEPLPKTLTTHSLCSS